MKNFVIINLVLFFIQQQSGGLINSFMLNKELLNYLIDCSFLSPQGALQVIQKSNCVVLPESNDYKIVCIRGGARSHLVYKFFNQSNDPLIILKHVIQDYTSAEMHNLVRVDALYSRLNEAFLYAQKSWAATDVAKLPTICHVRATCFYADQRGTFQLVEIIEAAPGCSLGALLDASAESLEKLPEKFFLIGAALAAFHRATLDTEKPCEPVELTSIIHGDFHEENVFINADDKVFFIDTTDMKYGSNILDIKRFVDRVGKKMRKKQGDVWCRFALEKFIAGYASVYPEKYQLGLRNLAFNLLK